MTLHCRLPLIAAAALLLTVARGVSLRAVPRGLPGPAAAPVRLDRQLGGGRRRRLRPRLPRPLSATRRVEQLGRADDERARPQCQQGVRKLGQQRRLRHLYERYPVTYREKLEAQLETWAARPAAEGRYVAVGGENYPDAWQSGSMLKSNCGDDMTSISCKEATLLAEGAARGAEWLVVVGEDNFVYTHHVEAFLEDKDPATAVAYGRVGCGRGLFCHDNEFFSTFGGFCGGAGYIISRAALQRLVADGAPALHRVYDKTANPNDMTTSCELARHGTRLHHTAGMNGFPLFMLQQYAGAAQSGEILTSHYVPPAAMRRAVLSASRAGAGDGSNDDGGGSEGDGGHPAAGAGPRR
ncbi:unnamed protein product [Prorocentrum cordatum]|uniref:N-acetylgalactosaminide beta-1,3-galactosyltransferase n=1 Tax=Prorocentrum cordatum TaxID=2364126 RepID=A0ABN9VK62_9DINO|nr:unnamed protein product [Polarella glacialis]